MPNVMAAQPNIAGAICKISVIPFRVLRRKVWLTPAAGVPCSNAAKRDVKPVEICWDAQTRQQTNLSP